MTQPLAIELSPSTSVTTAGSGSSVDIGALRRAIVLAISVTAFTSVDDDPEPLVVLTVETRASASDPWRAADAVALTGLGMIEFAVGGLDRYVRVSWSLTNMTSATFAVAGVAHVTYCDPKDLTRAVAEPAIARISASARVLAILGATARIDRYMNSSFVLPITAWGDDVRLDCAKLAVADLFRARGVDATVVDKVVFDAETDVLSEWKRIADGKLKPPGIVDSTSEVFEGGAVVVSRAPRRGW